MAFIRQRIYTMRKSKTKIGLFYKFLYDGRIFDFSEVFDAAKQSNLDVDAYIKKAGIIVVDEKGLPIPPAVLKKYKTPNGKIVDGSVLLQKYGNRFYKLWTM